MIAGEREAEIRKAVEASGRRLAKGELAATHRRELVPHPQVRSLGRGRGTESIYPYGTKDQVIAYARLKENFGRDYKRIGWELWILGFPVGQKYYQTPIGFAHDRFAKDTWTATGTPTALSEIALCAIDTISIGRSSTSTIGRLRRVLRKHHFSTLLRVVLVVADGKLKPSRRREDAEEEGYVFARALETRSARNKRKPSFAPEWLRVCPDEFAKMLKKLSGVISEYRRKPLPFSETEIMDARHELTSLLNLFLSIGAVHTQVYGRSNPALGLLSLIARDMTVKRHASFLLLWLIARRIPAVREGAQSLVNHMTRPAFL